MPKLIDLTGQRFERLIVKKILSTSPTKWECLCDCGKIVSVLGNNLKRGNTRSCGCLHSEIAGEIIRDKKKKLDDLTGKTYGYLTVKHQIPSVDKRKDRIWECECTYSDCGNFVRHSTARLKSGNTTTCGHHSTRPDISYQQITLINTDGKEISGSRIDLQKTLHIENLMSNLLSGKAKSAKGWRLPHTDPTRDGRGYHKPQFLRICRICEEIIEPKEGQSAYYYVNRPHCDLCIIAGLHHHQGSGFAPGSLHPRHKKKSEREEITLVHRDGYTITKTRKLWRETPGFNSHNLTNLLNGHCNSLLGWRKPDTDRSTTRNKLVIPTGSVYGILTVREKIIGKGDRKYECKCSCGNVVLALGYNLKNGHTKSCGCLRMKK